MQVSGVHNNGRAWLEMMPTMLHERKETYLPQNHKSLKHRAQGYVFFIFKLGAFTVCEEHRRALCLPACDGLGSAGLADNIDGLTDADRDSQGLQVLV